MSTSSSSSTFSRASAHALSFHSASSDTSNTSPFSGECKVDRDGFLDSKRRAGGPYLCSLPATFVMVSKEYEQQYHFHARTQEIYETTRSILQERRITHLDISVNGRRSRLDPESEPIPTVLVVVQTIPSPAEARRAARHIHHSLQATFPGICVDIMDAVLAKPFRSFPVARSETIFSKWDEIRDTILSTLDIREWVSLGCWRYGVSRSPAENPITVVVSVLKQSSSPWTTATRRIQGILSQFGVSDVDILFQKNEIRRYVENPILARDACTQSVQAGVSLGIHSSSAGSSTLGGIVELKLPGQAWRMFGLTCFHCVYAPPQHRQILRQVPDAAQAFDRWLENPVFPGDSMAESLLQVDHPSLKDLERSVSSYTSELEGQEHKIFLEIEERITAVDTGSEDVFVTPGERLWHKRIKDYFATLKTDRDYLESFLMNQSYVLGPVFAGSGLYRTGIRRDRPTEECILDWALIEIPESRLGVNMPYRYSTQQQLFLFKVEGDPAASQLYSKAGRSTGFTTGIYSELREAHIHRRWKSADRQYEVATTIECAIYDSEASFTEEGDSGSLVYDSSSGVVVGLFFGASELHTHSYFTPIRDVLQDIKEVTGAIEVRIARTLES